MIKNCKINTKNYLENHLLVTISDTTKKCSKENFKDTLQQFLDAGLLLTGCNKGLIVLPERNVLVTKNVLEKEPWVTKILNKKSPLQNKNKFSFKRNYRKIKKIVYFKIPNQISAHAAIVFKKEDEHFKTEFISFLINHLSIAIDKIKEQERLQKTIGSFVQASLIAIGMHDMTTKTHSERVASLSVELAKAVNKQSHGPYCKLIFSTDQIEEIRIASLLHDFGKIGVNEWLLQKEKKLMPFQLENIHTRFQAFKDQVYTQILENYINKLLVNKQSPTTGEIDILRQEFNSMVLDLDNVWEAVKELNEPQLLAKDLHREIEKISSFKFKLGKNTHALLSSNELDTLKTNKGSLTKEERELVQSHAEKSYEFLSQIHWTDNLSRMPDIVLRHHERLNGSGYPNHLVSEQIPVQSKILAICDIYDALVAYDRPYKKPVPTEKALEILELEVGQGKLDEHLMKLFIQEKIYQAIETIEPQQRSA